MNICIIGNTLGNLNYINKYARQSHADFVLCTGDVGMLPEGFYETPDFFTHDNFCDYMFGDKIFDVPVIATYGPHDNISMKDKIWNGDIFIENFHLLKNSEVKKVKGVNICGVGGTYSPRVYENGYKRYRDERHFTKEEVVKVRKKNIDILLMYDLIGECTKKQVNFSEETDRLIFDVDPKFCFLGRFGWWGSVKSLNTAFVSCPTADKGYMVVDTDKWDAYGVRFDLEDK